MNLKNSVIIVIVAALAVFFLLFFWNKGENKSVQNPDDNKNVPGNIGLSPQEGLPKAVEEKRLAIYAAAIKGDYEALAALADPDIKYSFGGPLEGGFMAFLKRAKDINGKNALDIIPELLTLPYTKMRETNIYAWPSVFAKSSQEWTNEDIAQMKTLMSDKLIEDYRKFGGYAYWRIGITEDGKWIYYIAGD